MAASPLRIVSLYTLSPGLGRWGFGWEQRADGQQRATHLTTCARELFPKPAIAIPVGQIPGILHHYRPARAPDRRPLTIDEAWRGSELLADLA
jgi:hypothetical protein